MNRTEAIANLNMISLAFVEAETKEQRKIIDDTFDVAIEALEQEPCEDAVSRQAVQDYIAKYLSQYLYNDVREAVEVIDEYIGELPSVKPQEPKIGHWILADEQNKEDVDNDNYRFICSECQCSDIHAKGTIVPYCWKCGARMESESET